MPTRSKRARVAGFATAAAVALAGVTGALHLPCARGLFARAGGCPMGGKTATAAEMETLRQRALVSLRGSEAAPARPAFRFALDETTHDDVTAWAAREGVACEDVRDGLVHCANVPPRALGVAEAEGPVAQLSLAFDTRARLVNLSTLRTHLTQDGARAALAAIGARLTAAIGAPHEGALDASRLTQQGIASLSQIAYRYRDYTAEVVAMRAAGDGLIVREHAMSARGEDPAPLGANDRRPPRADDRLTVRAPAP